MKLRYGKNSEKTNRYCPKSIVRERTELEIIRMLKQDMRANSKKLDDGEIEVEDYGEHNAYILGTLSDGGFFSKPNTLSY